MKKNISIICLILILFSCKEENHNATFIADKLISRDVIISRLNSSKNISDLKFIHLFSKKTKDSSKDDNRILIYFDIDRLDNIFKVDSAYLYLQPKKPVVGDTNYKIHRIKEPWSENYVNWDNQPLIYKNDSIIVMTNGLSENKIDITKYISGFSNGEYRNFGFELKLLGESKLDYSRITFHSSESESRNNRPRLEIYYKTRELF
ncbi:DNRLRE domain-containing protein [Galbibacter orientalis]|uniref:DNRLRE domain-containing protein n=1 Tax=Galbibacter orientalis TaxID=453852 RepID=UPI0030804EF4